MALKRKYTRNKRLSGLKIIDKICFFTGSSDNRAARERGMLIYSNTVTAKKVRTLWMKTKGSVRQEQFHLKT